MNNKHVLEANLVGLTLLSNADKSFGVGYQNYKLYKFNDCQHKEYLQPTHVRRNNVKCSICHENRIRDTAKTVGLTLVEKYGTHEFRKFISDSCGHELVLRVESLPNRAIGSCSVCFDIKLEKEANLADLDLVRDFETQGTYRRYKFKSCNHEQTIAHPCVKVGRFQCQSCKEDNFAKDAKKEGLLLIGHAVGKHNDHKRHYQLPCGHTRDLRMSHVKESRWECDICEDSHFNKESIVYLIKLIFDDFECLKLGYARNLQSRVWCYGLIKGVRIEEIHTINFATGKEAIVFEKSIHGKLSKYRINKNTMKKYMTNGTTECYPIYMLDALLSALTKGENGT